MLYQSALPYFRKAAYINPIYHNTQVLDNMISIVIGEQLTYPEMKRATVLALLHDIGNAESMKGKVKNSQIEDAIKHAQQHNDTTSWLNCQRLGIPAASGTGDRQRDHLPAWARFAVAPSAAKSVGECPEWTSRLAASPLSKPAHPVFIRGRSPPA